MEAGWMLCDVLQAVTISRRYLRPLRRAAFGGWLDFQVNSWAPTRHGPSAHGKRRTGLDAGAGTVGRCDGTGQNRTSGSSGPYGARVFKTPWLRKAGRRRVVSRANDIYDQFVRVPWQEGKRVAYFWIDAFRYDLAEQLATLASGRHSVIVKSVCAQLPTITKIGMAALLPGADEDFRVAVQGDEVVPVVKGRAFACIAATSRLHQGGRGTRTALPPWSFRSCLPPKIWIISIMSKC